MAFVGKFIYLVLFPGLLFVLLGGFAARTVLSGMSAALTGVAPAGPATGLPALMRLFSRECVATDGPLHGLLWSAPPVQLLALSWVSCIVFGFLPGDLALLFALLLLASGADILPAFCSANPRVRQNGFSQAARVLGWAVPLALVFALVGLRTGEISLTGLVQWQVANGMLIASVAGGTLAQVGTALGLAAALVGALSLARLRPLGPGLFDDPPGGVLCDVSGPPLAMMRLSETAYFFVAPLLIAALFFAGPASTWYEVAFWALKVAALVILLGVADLVSPRLRSGRALAWTLGAGGALSVAALVLVWVGVST